MSYKSLLTNVNPFSEKRLSSPNIFNSCLDSFPQNLNDKSYQLPKLFENRTVFVR